MKWSCEAGRF